MREKLFRHGLVRTNVYMADVYQRTKVEACSLYYTTVE